MAGAEPERTYVDRGYRGHDYAHKERVFIARQPTHYSGTTT
jgi:transposase, IS5 family